MSLARLIGAVTRELGPRRATALILPPEINSARLELIYRGELLGIVRGLFAGVVLVWLLANDMPFETLAAWSALALSFLAVRAALFAGYLRRDLNTTWLIDERLVRARDALTVSLWLALSFLVTLHAPF